MRKTGKVIPAISISILIAFYLPVVTFAAGGWQKERTGEEEEAWVYLDENGNKLTDVFLEDGEDKYYLNENGIMVTNQWVAYPKASGVWDMDGGNLTGGAEKTDVTAWYYFGSSGKAYRGVRKSIGGNTYVFHEDGSMIADKLLHLEDGSYYVNGDGVLARNQWVSFLNGPGNNQPCEEPVSTVWYYFDSAGKACEGKKKKIGDNYYIFDDEGHMLSGWQTYGDDSKMYYLGTEDQGFIHTGWVYTYAPPDTEASGEEGWYYLEGKGVPFNYQSKNTYEGRDEKGWNYGGKIDGDNKEEESFGVAARVINKKTYLFDKEGRMLTGFYYMQGVKRHGGSDLGLIRINNEHFTGTYYYFNEEEGPAYGQMMTGRQTVEGDSDTYHYYFKDNGQAYYRTIVDGYLYDELGRQVKSDSGGYLLYEIPERVIIFEKGSSKKHMDAILIINPSGKLKKSGTVTIDGIKYTVKNYEVIQAEDGS